MNEISMKSSFLDSLPRLSKDSTLFFQCDPSVPCFNRCCGDLHLTLSPYDVLRLRNYLEVDSRTFIENYADVEVLQGNQFPSIKLRMDDHQQQSCPFVRDTGCSVYSHRPGACRVYPLGRGASIDEHGKIHEEYILVKEPHCFGFASSTPISISDYLESQGMGPYISFDDRYIQLMHRWNQYGRPLPKSLFGKVFIAVYRPDDLHLIREDISPSLPKNKDTRNLKCVENELLQAFCWLEENIFKK